MRGNGLRFRSIRFRLTLVIGLAFVPVLLVLFAAHLQYVQDRRVMLEHEKAEAASLLALSVNQALTETCGLLKFQCETILAEGIDTESARQMLQRVADAEDLRSVTLVEKQGVVLCSTDPAREGTSLADRESIRCILAGQCGAVFHHVETDEPGPPHFHILAALEDQGELVGVVSSQIEAEGFVKHLDLEVAGEYCVLDYNGAIVYGSSQFAPSHLIGAPMFAKHPAFLASRTGDQSFCGVEAMPGRDEPSVIAIEPVGETGWAAVAASPAIGLRQWLSDTRGYTLIAISVIALAGTASGLYLSRSLSMPLVRLMRHVRRIGDGVLDQPIPVEEGGEFREFAELLETARTRTKFEIEILNAMVALCEELMVARSAKEVFCAIVRHAPRGADVSRVEMVVPPGAFKPEPAPFIWQAGDSAGSVTPEENVLSVHLEGPGGSRGSLTVHAADTSRLQPHFLVLASLVSLSLTSVSLREASHHLAESLQAPLLSVPLQFKGLEIASAYRSADDRARIGGDFYSVFEIAPDRYGVLIGDVSGKGLGASVLTYLMKYTVEALACASPTSPASVISGLNARVFEVSQPETYATAFFGVIDFSEGRLVYCNAGHPPMILLTKEGPRLLARTGPIVGAYGQNVNFHEAEEPLAFGDVLALFTDGLLETRGEEGLYGEQRLLSSLAEASPDSPHGMLAAVLSDLDDFSHHSLHDDLALLVIKLTESRFS